MDGQYVGIDLHRRRAVVQMSATGEQLSCVRIANDPWLSPRRWRRRALSPRS
jgi:hypothetical protein